MATRPWPDPPPCLQIVVSLVNGRPGATNFSYSPLLRDFTKATNIRLRFLRTNTLLGHLMGKALRDPTVTRRVSTRAGWARPGWCGQCGWARRLGWAGVGSVGWSRQCGWAGVGSVGWSGWRGRARCLAGLVWWATVLMPWVQYYYSIKDISIGGRCVCHGHADVCDAKDPTDPFR